MRILIVMLIIVVVITICVLLFYKPKSSSDFDVPTKNNKRNKSGSNDRALSYQPDTYGNDSDNYEVPTKRH